MKYLVSTIRVKDGVSRSKTVTVEAINVKNAEAIVKDKYPNDEIVRITAEEVQVDYWNLLKKGKLK
jgi:hypothetical protein